ncbi:MAG: hypothetical protein PUB19_04290 [Lachnospiraceae bacterium]|nr:hypothetical protein [Lachnospiraceae bacterium]
MSRVLPILFNTDMVQAILDGRKTVTRRCIKFLNAKNPNWTGYVKDGLMLYNGTNEPCIKPCQYQPGDILYVRETWGEGYEEGTYIYKADDKLANLPEFKESSKLIYHPSIHMPKEAARIWLKVKDVWVEQLQECGKDWCLGIEKEGVVTPQNPILYINDDEFHDALREEFQKLWNSTIKKSDLDRYGWDANPWVWVIEFERCERPEGA